MERPLIGITASPRLLESSEGKTRAHALYATYSGAVARAGGIPVALIPHEDVSGLGDRIDGLILSGGGDVDPARYGSPGHEAVYGVDPERDEFELMLVDEASRRDLPLLAICRGMQLLAVAYGGTLITDLPSLRPDSEPHRMAGPDLRRGVQAVEVTESCRLASVVRSTQISVNSYHHQAIDVMPAGWRATAHSPDGVIEAMEPIEDEWPVLAVQWHPEWLDSPDTAAIFTWLVTEATSRATAPR